MAQKGVERLAAAWADAQAAYGRGDITKAQWKSIFAVNRLGRSDPEALWEVIVSVLELSPGPEVREVLAAGPLEDLIRRFGAEMLGRISAKAAEDADFAELLKGVWLRSSNDPITKRYLELGCDEVAV